MSPVTVLLFNYYCFQIPFSIHSSIYVLIGPFNNQKTETAKVGVCVLSAVPLCSCDKLSVANVLLLCGAWPLSTSTFSAGSGDLLYKNSGLGMKKLRGEWLQSAVVLLEQSNAEAQERG